MRHAGSFAFKSPPTPTPAKTSLPAFSHRASAPSHPWQTGSTPAAFQLSRSQSLFEKYQAASRLSIKRVIATYTNVSLVVGNSSSSLLNRRHWFNQANVLSTTQRCGNTAKPFCPSTRTTDSRTIWYFSLTHEVHSAPRYVPSTHTLRSFLHVPRICLKIFRAPAWSEREAAVTTTISNNPRVSTHTWRLRPLTFLPLSNPLSTPPTSVVFTD